MHFEEMSPEDLYGLGKQIAELAKTRPDIVHRMFLGMHHGFQERREHSLGRVLEMLWRHGTYDVPESLKIPFEPLSSAPSGSKG